MWANLLTSAACVMLSLPLLAAGLSSDDSRASWSRLVPARWRPALPAWAERAPPSRPICMILGVMALSAVLSPLLACSLLGLTLTSMGLSQAFRRGLPGLKPVVPGLLLLLLCALLLGLQSGQTGSVMPPELLAPPQSESPVTAPPPTDVSPTNVSPTDVSPADAPSPDTASAGAASPNEVPSDLQ